MFKSLRSRLLISYTAVILITLIVVTAAFVLIGSQPQLRYAAALQRLDAISRASGVELLRLRQSGTSNEQIVTALEDTAQLTGVRVLIAERDTSRIVYDTRENNSWVGDVIEIDQLPNRLIPTADPVFAGLYSRPNGTRWLLYTRPIQGSNFGRAVIVYAIAAPSPLAFFRDLSLGRFLFFAGLVAFIVGSVLAAVISSSVARPLQKTAAAAEAITAGDYDQQLSLEGPVEVQSVAQSFNVMAAEVSETQRMQRDFLANVSHDLKTPITSISGWSQALLDGTADSPDSMSHAAQRIHSEAARMQRMVNQLLDMARLESGQIVLTMSEVDLAELLQELQQSLLIRAQEKGVDLTLALQPLPTLEGDHDRLMQVFTNLVENAITHTGPGGAVEIKATPHGTAAVEVVVADSGRGMPAAELERIFERFYQIDKSRATRNGRSGSGLGLSIARHLVEAHHGAIQVQSKEGEGTAFTVRLPIDSAPAATTRRMRRPD